MAQEIVTVISVIDKATNRLKNIERETTKLSGATQTWSKQVKGAGKNANQFVTTMKKTTTGVRKFKFEFLGLMFFGMMIQRTFSRLMQAGTSTFKKLTESTTFWSSSIGKLSANITFLKFAIGDAISTALEPLMPTIIRVIEGIVNWIEQNKGLTAGLIVGGLVVGIFLALLGQMVLGFVSLRMAIEGVLGSKGLKGIWLWLNRLNPLWLLLAFLVTLATVALFKHPEAIEEVKPAWDSLIDKIKELFTPLMEAIGLHADWAGIAAITASILQFLIGTVELLINVLFVLMDIIGLAVVGLARLKEIITGEESAFGDFGKATELLAKDWRALSSSMVDVKNPAENLAAMQGRLKDKTEETADSTSDLSTLMSTDLDSALVDATAEVDELTRAFKNQNDWATTLNNSLQTLSQTMGGVGGGGGVMGSFQAGGVVPKTGPYLLHKGETVVPTGQTNTLNMGNMNVSVNAGGTSDPHAVANIVGERLMTRLRRNTAFARRRT